MQVFWWFQTWFLSYLGRVFMIFGMVTRGHTPQGTCVSGHCQCRTGFAGESCEVEIPKATKPSVQKQQQQPNKNIGRAGNSYWKTCWTTWKPTPFGLLITNGQASKASPMDAVSALARARASTEAARNSKENPVWGSQNMPKPHQFLDLMELRSIAQQPLFDLM